LSLLKKNIVVVLPCMWSQIKKIGPNTFLFPFIYLFLNTFLLKRRRFGAFSVTALKF